MGSSVAYKTGGPFLSQKMGHQDARGQSTGQTKAEAVQRNAVTTARQQLPDHTANYRLSSLISGNAATPPPLRAPFGGGGGGPAEFSSSAKEKLWSKRIGAEGARENSR